MKNRSNWAMPLIIFIVIQLFYSCFSGLEDSIKPELSIKIEKGKTLLNIGGRTVGETWFYIFENNKNIKIDKHYSGRHSFEEQVGRNVKIIIDPEPVIDFHRGISKLEIVKNEIEANGKDRIYLERNTKYGIYFFFQILLMNIRFSILYMMGILLSSSSKECVKNNPTFPHQRPCARFARARESFGLSIYLFYKLLAG